MTPQDMTDPGWSGDLAQTRRQVWRLLVRGVADRRAAARHPVLATLGARGFPEVRTVVLRGADAQAGTLELHTDSASAKVGEIARHPQAGLHVWDERARLQIRLRVEARLLTGRAAEAAWERVPEAARTVYGGAPAPGTEIAAPEAHRAGPDPARFAVIAARAIEIETLHLGPERHRRARFARADGWAGSWLAP